MFDSKKSTSAFYDEILAEFGLPPLTADLRNKVYTCTTSEALNLLFIGSPHLDDAQAYALTVDNQHLVKLMSMEPNLRETLEILNPTYKTAIATNRGRSMPLVLSAHNLDHLFDYIVTSADVVRPKPHPECLLKILNHFDARPEEGIYIGDAEVDQRVSEAAGVSFVAYKNPELNGWKHLNDHMDIITILQNDHPE